VLVLLGLLGLAAVDGLNPSIILTTLVLLTTERPVPRVAAYLAGVYATNWTLGVVAYAGLGVGIASVLDAVLDASAWWVYVLELVAGVVLLVAAWRLRPGPAARPARAPRASVAALFALGVGATFVEFSTAAPYLAAIATLARADASLPFALTALTLYNVVYVAVPLGLLGAYLARPAGAAARLERLGPELGRRLKTALRLVFAVLGAVLVADFVAYVLGDPFFGDASPAPGAALG
jgi:hypothetical protein